MTRDSVTALLDGTDRRVVPTAAEVTAAQSELVGPAGLTRAEAAFTRDDVLVAWTERCTQGARRSELEGLADDTLADPAIVPLVVADETGRPLTTDRPRDGHTIVRLVRVPVSGDRDAHLCASLLDHRDVEHRISPPRPRTCGLR